ncbi:MAG: hypothetical protein Fur005_15490 [Roseiflexaceae bacterium]
MIASYRSTHAEQLYTLYRRQVAMVPHTLLPSLARFDAGLAAASEQILVAEEAGVVQGFAALARVSDHQETEADAIMALCLAEDAEPLVGIH